jgi:3-oxoacyl-[acyl-carrier-protein] synthase II
MKPLAATGIGLVSPLGTSAEELMAGLDAGRSGITPVELPREAVARRWAGRRGWAGRIADFDPGPALPPMRARRLDRASQFAVVAAWQACRAAGLAASPRQAAELGVIVGTSSAGSGPLTAFLASLFRQSPEAAPPSEFPNTVANAPASHVAIELGLKGPNLALSHSEAVIGMAVLCGRQMLADRRCRALLVGAVDEWNPYFELGFARLGTLRRAPRGGGGTVLAEGAAFLALECEESARARGAHTLARLLGLAVRSVPGEPHRWLPDAPTLEAAIREALDRSGLRPTDVGSVMLAANGIESMERAEAEALAEVFAGCRLAASGVKGGIGERAVAGALSLVVAVLARERGVLPPFGGGALSCWPDPVRPATVPTPLPSGATLVLLSGFGGNYAAAVVA